MILRFLFPVLVVFLSLSDAVAQDIRTETLNPEALPILVEASISGEDITDYVVAGRQGQILAVDMAATNGAAYFNILPSGQDQGLFNGSIEGNVADITLTADGDVIIRVYLMASAARRGETAEFSLLVGLRPQDFADGIAGGPDYWAVTGVTDSLNVREGPDTRYPSVSRLANGEVLQNRGCRMTGQERWCDVRTVGSGVSGWVAGRYLSEAAAPATAAMPEGGPVGNGVAFDATGSLPCSIAAEPSMEQCLFGVIRQGPGNAGVWIATGGGAERQILFEGGVPVAVSPGVDFIHDKTGDLYVIDTGAERFEVPEAVINGG